MKPTNFNSQEVITNWDRALILRAVNLVQINGSKQMINSTKALRIQNALFGLFDGYFYLDVLTDFLDNHLKDGDQDVDKPALIDLIAKCNRASN